MVRNGTLLCLVLGSLLFLTNISFQGTGEKIQEEVTTIMSNDKPSCVQVPSAYFIKNVGQINSKKILYYSRDGNVHFTSDGVFIRFREMERILRDEKITSGWNPIENEGIFSEKGVILYYKFVDSNPCSPIGNYKLAWNTNYFKGNEIIDWHTNIPCFQQIIYPNIWDNIDLKFYLIDQILKYDIIIKKGSDPKDIIFNIKGSEGLRINGEGDLVIKTGYKDIIDNGLYTYYEDDAARIEIGSHFQLISPTTYSIRLNDYDIQRNVVIDPTLDFSTVIGGSDHDVGISVYIDKNNNSYITGYSQDGTVDYPTTTGAYDKTYNGGRDVFVTKMNSSGTGLLYSTFIGGSSSSETGYSIKVDSVGNAYITGYSEDSTTDYPTTTGVFDTTHNGKCDAFITKLNSTGSNLLFSTFLGGSEDDIALDIELNTDGNIFITGYTVSSNFPATSGAYDTTFGGNNYNDGWITKLSQNGTSLVYSTFIGGSNEDVCRALVIDSNGDAYLTGNTKSTDFPVTSGALDTSHNNNDDVFIVKVGKTGASLVFSTYIGGSASDIGMDIDIDGNGYCYFTGYSEYSFNATTDYPTTSGAYDTSHNGYTDGFVSKINSTGSSLVYSTFIGGSNDDQSKCINIDPYGIAHISGWTYQANYGRPGFPTTSDGYDTTHNGKSDVFYSRISSSGDKLEYSTLLGGSEQDEGYGMVINDYGDINLVGVTLGGSPAYPTTAGAYDTTHNGLWDVFLTRIALDLEPPSFGTDSTPVMGTTGDIFKFQIAVTDNIGLRDVIVEYWFGNQSVHSNKSMGGSGPYSYSITIPSDSILELNYRFHARDLDFNRANSSKKVVIISDNDKPKYPTDSTPIKGNTGDLFQFSIEVTDNICVSSVWVNYWFGSGTVTNSSMVNGVIYHLNITIPYDSTDVLYYKFLSNDTSDNWVVTTQRTVIIYDNDPIVFINDLTPNFCLTGDLFTFSLEAYDNIGIDFIEIEYWFGSGPHFFKEMMGSGFFWYNITVPSDSTDPLNYFFNSNDIAGNQNSTTQKFVVVLDDDLPSLTYDHTVLSISTGDVLTFIVDICDNVKVHEVWTEYWFGSGPHNNLSMVRSGNYQNSITIPMDSIEELHYIFHFNDTSDNWNSTHEKVVLINDDDVPIFLKDQTLASGSTGDLFLFKINISDNIGIESVWLEHWTGSGSHSNNSMSGSGEYLLEIMIDANSTEMVNYIFHANDTSGNWNSTMVKTLLIIDNDRPIFGYDIFHDSIKTGAVLTISIPISDNIAIKDAYLEYWFGSEPHKNITLTGTGLYSFEVTIPKDTLDPLYYLISVVDISGNWNSLEGHVNIVDGFEPISNPGPDRTIDEDLGFVLNGSLSSDNIGIVDLIWSFKDGGRNIVLYGWENTYTFYDPGVYEIMLNVTDSAGLWNLSSFTLTVSDVTAPRIVLEPVEIDEDTVHLLNGMSCSDNVGIVNWTWSFMDVDVDRNLYGGMVEYSFETPGTYNISLTVIDLAGNRISSFIIIKVRDVTEPDIDAGNDLKVVEGSKVLLESLGMDNVGIVNWTWTFKVEGNQIKLFGNGVYYTFENPGIYMITLTCSDEAGNIDIDFLNITVLKEKEGDNNLLASGPITLLFAIGLVLIVVMVVIALVLLYKRKRSSTQIIDNNIEGPQMETNSSEGIETISLKQNGPLTSDQAENSELIILDLKKDEVPSENKPEEKQLENETPGK